MSKFTPGPWKVSGVGAVIGRYGEYIASVQPLMATRYNAALIAEAPAMAELLLSIVNNGKISNEELADAQAILERMSK